MKLKLNNKNVIITGGTRGIGKSIAKKFIEYGANVFITGTKDVNSFKSNLKIKDYMQLNSYDEYSIKNFYDQVRKMTKIDILINNMGINKIDHIQDIKTKDFNSLINTNLKIPFYLSQLVSKKMIKKRKGKILNISSIWSIVSKEKRVSYATSKSGLNGLTRSLAVDLGKYNILVNSLSPGVVYTDLTKKVLGKEINSIKRLIPLKRLASTKEISSAAIFLCSDLNTYVTGQNIMVDGGYTAI